jgi:hypothetical protein
MSGSPRDIQGLPTTPLSKEYFDCPQPLCTDSVKIPEGRTSTYIVHLSGLTYGLCTERPHCCAGFHDCLQVLLFALL